MTEPLLVLAANPESLRGALRMGENQLHNQSVEVDDHPFARLLTGHAAKPGGEARGPLAELPALLAGGRQGQPPTAGGKDLPDAARLLALAGFDLAELETGPDPAADTSGSVLPASADLAGADALAQGYAPVAADPDGREAIGVAQGILSEGADPGVRGVSAPAGGESGPWPGRSLGQAQPGQSGSVLPVTAPVTPEDGEAQPRPEPMRTLNAEIHQAMLQRAAEEGRRDARLADLPRASAGRGAEPVPRIDAASIPGLQSLGTPQPTPVQAPTLPATTLPVPLGQSGWDQALGERVQWMVGNRLQGAEIRLNPAHLGPMEVRIQMQNDQANITFTAQHGVTREALEAAMPRLREMLGESGLQLNQVTVSDQSLAEQRRQDARDFQADPAAARVAGSPEEEAVAVAVTPLRQAAGTIDFFA